VSNLQVKNLPDDLHEKLRERAREQHTTVSQLVTRILNRELARPSMDQWLAQLDSLPRTDKDIDTQAVLDEIRGPWPDDVDARP